MLRIVKNYINGGGTMYPVYADKIIVSIVKDKLFSWKITDRDWWFLDYNKLERAYQDKGFDVVIDASARFGIKVLENDTAEAFMKKTKFFSVTKEELREMIQESKKEEILAFIPSIYVNFDEKIFISFYPEPESFEEFVPDGWKGDYYNFMDLIPHKEKYWIDDNGNNIFERR